MRSSRWLDCCVTLRITGMRNLYTLARFGSERSAFGPDSAELLGALDSLAYVYFGREEVRRSRVRLPAVAVALGDNGWSGASDGGAYAG